MGALAGCLSDGYHSRAHINKHQDETAEITVLLSRVHASVPCVLCLYISFGKETLVPHAHARAT